MVFAVDLQIHSVLAVRNITTLTTPLLSLAISLLCRHIGCSAVNTACLPEQSLLMKFSTVIRKVLAESIYG